MKIKPNLGVPTRVAYVTSGLALTVVPSVAGLSGSVAILLPLVGIATMLAGLSGV